MFDEVHIRTLENNGTYVNVMDLAEHLANVAIALRISYVENPPADYVTEQMDLASIETMKLIIQFLMQGEEIEYMRNNLDTYEDFFAMLEDND